MHDAAYVTSPFTLLIDTAEKAPFSFNDIRARSFIDKDMRLYAPKTERRFLGVGCGDYSLDGFTGRCGIERKSMVDFQGTLLGWRHEADAGGGWSIDVDRRARFKRELKTLSTFECKAIVVEAPWHQCYEEAPEWGKRTQEENCKYLRSTMLAWYEEFPGVPWIFEPDRRHAEITVLRILEKYWARMSKKRRAKKIEQQHQQPLLTF